MADLIQTKDFQATIDAEDYITRFRDVERFIGYCRECGNYGRCWACPPFDIDWDEVLAPYTKVTLYVTQIFIPGMTPATEARSVIRPVRADIETRLRDVETLTGGRAFAFAGTCLYCPEGECSRLTGEPCRHPELVRPSLEALGFDIGRTTAEIFDLPILWAADGYLPAYYLLVAGVFHN